MRSPILLQQRRWRFPWLLAATFAVFACQAGGLPSADDDVPAPELVLSNARKIIAAKDALLAQPSDVAIDSAGRAYVLDRRDARVLRVDETGKAVHFLGQRGPGPGEFTRPSTLAITEEMLRVFDSAAGTIQTFSLENGQYMETVIPETPIGPAARVAFGHTGIVAYAGATVAMREGALAVLIDDSGKRNLLVGEPVPGPEFEPSMRAAVLRREFPGALRSHALPIVGSNGALALVLHTEGIVREYDAAGTLTKAFSVAGPELESVVDAFVEWYSPPEAEKYNRFFEAVEDAEMAEDGELWILWNMPRDRRPIISVIAPDREEFTRLVLAGVEMEARHEAPEIPPRRHFAVDRSRKRILLVNNVELIEIPLEPFVRREK